MVTELQLIAARAVAVLALLTSLSGCTFAGHEFAPPGLFNHVNAVVEDLDVSSLDGLVREGRFGVGGNDRPQYAAAVEGEEALPEMQHRLTEAGFVSDGLLEEIGQEAWTPSEPSGDYIEVILRPRAAGGGVSFGPDTDFTMKKDGLVIGVLG